MFEDLDPQQTQLNNTPPTQPQSRPRPPQPNQFVAPSSQVVSQAKEAILKIPSLNQQEKIQNPTQAPQVPDDLPVGNSSSIPEARENQENASIHQAPPTPPYQYGAPQEPLPEDIFGTVDKNIPVPKVVSAPFKMPTVNTGEQQLPTPSPISTESALTQQNPSQPEDALPKIHHQSRKALVFILSSFILALFLIGSYLVFRIIKVGGLESVLDTQERDEESSTQIPENTPPQETNVSTQIEEPTSQIETQAEPVPPINPQVAQPQVPIQDTSQPTETTIENVEQPETPSDALTNPPPPVDVAPAPPTIPIVEQKDSDGDGLYDNEELLFNTNPKVLDTDLDNLDDYAEVKTYFTNPIKADTDGDRLIDGEEVSVGSNPNQIDTDEDGLNDYDEVRVYNSSPISDDTDKDGYKDGAEVQNGYDPVGTGKLPKY